MCRGRRSAPGRGLPISVTAAYGGDVSLPTYSSSTSTFAQTMTQDTTSITLIVDPKKPVAGGPVGSFTGVILNPPPGSGAISGVVDYQIIGKHTGPLSCDNLTNNVASLTGTNEVTCNITAVPERRRP